MEIERKFTIKELPDHLEQYEKREIEQAYLCKKPTIRIRKSNENYILTYKSRMGLDLPETVTARTCEEVELPLSPKAYEHLKEKADGNVISKTRYLIPIDESHPPPPPPPPPYLEGLMFAEVEFANEEESAAYQMPDWFLEDVTFDKRYRNSFLASFSSLEELKAWKGNPTETNEED